MNESYLFAKSHNLTFNIRKHANFHRIVLASAAAVGITLLNFVRVMLYGYIILIITIVWEGEKGVGCMYVGDMYF